MRFGLFLIVCSLAMLGCQEPSGNGLTGMMLIKNAKIYTMAPGATKPAEAMCIRGDRILFVGGENRAAACAGPRRQVIDAGGRAILPGLIDAHTHIFSRSIADQRINLSHAETLADLKAALARIRDLNPGEAPIIARGWQNHVFPPEGPPAALLDGIFGDRIVIIDAVDGHSTWFSSAAFAAAYVTAETEDPAPGVSYFERSADTGMPLGTAREGARDIIKQALVPILRQDPRAALLKWLPRANAAGLTTVVAAGMAAPLRHDGYAILKGLMDEGMLPLRVFSTVHAGGPLYKEGRDSDPFAELSQLKQDFQSTLVQPLSVKVFVDGVPEEHTAFSLPAYMHDSATQGAPMLSKADLNALVLEGQKARVPIHMHAIGGAAVKLSLDAVEAAQRQINDRSVRHVIAYRDVVAREDILRFAKLNVVAQTSIQWAMLDPRVRDLSRDLYESRLEAGYPAKSLIEAGAVHSFGTNWPASTYLPTSRPFDMVEVAVTRRLPGAVNGPVRAPGERLSVMQALSAMTISAAYQLNAEDDIGSLEAGKAADFIVLDQDVFSIPVETIHKTQSLMTVVGGRIVYEIGRE